jgi:hypothetical protein
LIEPRNALPSAAPDTSLYDLAVFYASAGNTAHSYTTLRLYNYTSLLSNGGDTGLCLTKKATTGLAAPMACPCGSLPTGAIQTWATVSKSIYTNYIQIGVTSTSTSLLSLIPALPITQSMVTNLTFGTTKWNNVQFVPVYKGKAVDLKLNLLKRPLTCAMSVDVMLFQDSTPLGIPYFLYTGYYATCPSSFTSSVYISVPSGYQVTIINSDGTTANVANAANPSLYTSVVSLNITGRNQNP